MNVRKFYAETIVPSDDPPAFVEFEKARLSEAVLLEAWRAGFLLVDAPEVIVSVDFQHSYRRVRVYALGRSL